MSGHRRQLVGGGQQDRDQAAEHVARGRQEDVAREHVVQRMEPELQAGDDAEVRPGAAHGPEQVGVLDGAGDPSPAVRRHDLDREQAVDRHPMLPDQPADAAAERDPGNADGSGVPERGHEAMRVGGARVLAGEDAGVGPGRPPDGVDLHVAHRRQVQEERAVARAVAHHAVAAGSNDQRQAPVLGVRDQESHVRRVGRTGDEGGAPVDRRVVDPAGAVVVIGARARSAGPGTPGRGPRRTARSPEAPRSIAPSWPRRPTPHSGDRYDLKRT